MSEENKIPQQIIDEGVRQKETGASFYGKLLSRMTHDELCGAAVVAWIHAQSLEHTITGIISRTLTAPDQSADAPADEVLVALEKKDLLALLKMAARGCDDVGEWIANGDPIDVDGLTVEELAALETDQHSALDTIAWLQPKLEGEPER